MPSADSGRRPISARNLDQLSVGCTQRNCSIPRSLQPGFRPLKAGFGLRGQPSSFLSRLRRELQAAVTADHFALPNREAKRGSLRSIPRLHHSQRRQSSTGFGRSAFRLAPDDSITPRKCPGILLLSCGTVQDRLRQLRTRQHVCDTADSILRRSDDSHTASGMPPDAPRMVDKVRLQQHLLPQS